LELEEVKETKILFSLYLSTSKSIFARLYVFYWQTLWIFTAHQNY